MRCRRVDHHTALHHYSTFQGSPSLLCCQSPCLRQKVQLSCSNCKKHLFKKRGIHEECGGRLTWYCVGSKCSGIHKTYVKHTRSCIHCTSAMVNPFGTARERGKENRMIEMELAENGVGVCRV